MLRVSLCVLMLTLIDQRKSHRIHSRILHNFYKYSWIQIKKKIYIFTHIYDKKLFEFKSNRIPNGRIYNLFRDEKRNEKKKQIFHLHGSIFCISYAFFVELPLSAQLKYSFSYIFFVFIKRKILNSTAVNKINRKTFPRRQFTMGNEKRRR